MKKILYMTAVAIISLNPSLIGADKKAKAPQPASGLDQYVDEAILGAEAFVPSTPGSLWVDRSFYSDLARDVRSRNVNDIVIIQVSEHASAIAKGDLKSARQSSLKASASSTALTPSANAPLAGLLTTGMNSNIDGQASTSRETLVTTTLGARVTRVLPNGYLVIEGTKEVQLNSERQIVTVRGVARPVDLNKDNAILSDRLAQLEVRVNGKGVVGDAIRRPFFLYRLLMGILPL